MKSPPQRGFVKDHEFTLSAFLVSLPIPAQGHFQRRRRAAFSLVELLVVITVIAILAALLLTAIEGARESGYRTKCMTHQRQLVTAMIAYSADHAGFLPYPNWGNANGIPGWLYTAPNMSQQKDLQAGLLWPYLGNAEVYSCPMDRPSPEQLAERDVKISSYCLNGAICGYGARAATASPNTYLVNQFSGNAVCLWEQDEGNNGFWFNDGSNQPDEGISKRHKGGAIVSCFDGHSEWLTWDQYNAEKDVSPGRFWCNPVTANGH